LDLRRVLEERRWDLVISDPESIEEHVQQRDRLTVLGQLAGGIAHDFNNVLMAIMLYAEMVMEDPSLPSDLAPDVGAILNEAQDAALLVRQVLDFCRCSPMETRLVDLKSLLQESAGVLRRTMREDLRLLLEIGPDEYVVEADLGRIQQAVMNLVLNARDAMPEGGELRLCLSRMEVGSDPEPFSSGSKDQGLVEGLPVGGMPSLSSPPLAGGIEGGEWVCLSVSDTGVGIPPEVLPRLFEPFFTTKPRGQGTGLGLTQVYDIVKQHGGYIGVDTRVGEGTTFRVYLPAQEMTLEELQGEDVASVPLRGRGEIVLVVEDEDRIRGLCQRILESLGYQVLTAANGREALDVYRAIGKVDLVVTDLVMPEMGGKSLIRELRKVNPDLKFVAMTGYVLMEDLQQLKEEGLLEVIHKPLDTDTLAQVVRWALDSSLP
jgi:signal transduction histidine kinase/CheY-like chemotaxis protein